MRDNLQTEPSPPAAISGKHVVAWVLGIIIWVMICASYWFVATRDDYAKLNAARACYGANDLTRSSNPQCATIKPSDALFYKSEIDRKARNSRLASAFGGLVAAILIMVSRRKRKK
ncbi:MAG TPA: hypothetical protein VMH84_03930 [Xanthobacteraceae bacterium]|nr:hypothetical protein [Xanthobacteraceae bacterium]